MVTAKRDSFDFKELDVTGVPSAPDAGISVDWENSGKCAALDNENDCSVNRQKASMYLFLCCCYNCCFPCSSIESILGPVCGRRFLCSWAYCVEIEMRRDRWLLFANLVCCLVHTCFTVLTLAIGWGNDMALTIFRTVPKWENRGASGYTYEVVADFTVRLDVVVACFFGLSAVFHSIWILFGGCAWANWFLWKSIDRCICYLRWIEYSFSASLMLVSIGLITGLRDGPTLVGVFSLTWTTMLCGLLTECSSRPDPLCYDEQSVLTTDCDKWQFDPDPTPWGNFDFKSFYEKLKSYMWRMLPHWVGWVPYLSAWWIVLNNFLRQLADIPEDLRNRIPSFVIPSVLGTAIIFSLFAIVQMRYQWIAPKYYWRTELHYCALSLTAKLFLGGLLLVNVISAASVEEALAITNSIASASIE